MSTLARMSGVKQEHRGRINLRVNPEQEARLRAAAEVNGETLTGFLLAAGTERADEVLSRARRISVDRATFDRFVAALDAPAEPMPTVERYSSKSSPIPAD